MSTINETLEARELVDLGEIERLFNMARVCFPITYATVTLDTFIKDTINEVWAKMVDTGFPVSEDRVTDALWLASLQVALDRLQYATLIRTQNETPMRDWERDATRTRPINRATIADLTQTTREDTR